MHNLTCAVVFGAALTVNWTGEEQDSWAAALADAGGQAVGSVLHRRGLPTRLAEVGRAAECTPTCSRTLVGHVA